MHALSHDNKAHAALIGNVKKIKINPQQDTTL